MSEHTFSYTLTFFGPSKNCKGNIDDYKPATCTFWNCPVQILDQQYNMPPVPLHGILELLNIQIFINSKRTQTIQRLTLNK